MQIFPNKILKRISKKLLKSKTNNKNNRKEMENKKLNSFNLKIKFDKKYIGISLDDVLPNRTDNQLKELMNLINKNSKQKFFMDYMKYDFLLSALNDFLENNPEIFNIISKIEKKSFYFDLYLKN